MAGPVKVTITGDAAPFRRTLARTGQDADRFGDRMGRWGGRMAGIMATAFATDRIVGWGRSLFEQGQQLQVWDAKVDTVFGAQAASIRKWADENNEAFGITDSNLAGLAANFADLLKPMGFTADEASSMTQDVLGLSAALSAWSGGTRDTAEVSQILSKAMLGERESLKELGISINQAEVDTRAAELAQQGMGDATAQTTKAMATQQLIFEKSTDAQKAWADGTFDGIKKTNELKATWSELSETLAEQLQPKFQSFTDFMVDELIPTFSEDGWLGALELVGSEIASLLGLDPEKFRSGFEKVTEAFADFKTTFQERGWVGVVEDIGAELAEMFGLDPEKFRSGFGEFVERFESGLQRLRDNWEPFLERFQSGLERVARALGIDVGPKRGVGGLVATEDKMAAAAGFVPKGVDGNVWQLGQVQGLTASQRRLFAAADGGMLPDGLSLVGERGAELVTKRGASVQVSPLNGRSPDISGGGTHVDVKVYGHDWSLGQALEAAVTKMEHQLTMRAS